MTTDEISQITSLTSNYLFSNVTVLELIINKIWSVDLIEHLSTIVNLSNLQKLELYFQYN
ncbi:unnamed protein product, partial [Rotaria sordida]